MPFVVDDAFANLSYTASEFTTSVTAGDTATWTIILRGPSTGAADSYEITFNGQPLWDDDGGDIIYDSSDYAADVGAVYEFTIALSTEPTYDSDGFCATEDFTSHPTTCERNNEDTGNIITIPTQLANYAGSVKQFTGAENLVVEILASSDTTPPVIALNGPATFLVDVSDTYTPSAATCADEADGAITDSSKFSNDAATTVTDGTIGDYTVTFTCADAAGNSAIAVQQTVSVIQAITIHEAGSHVTAELGDSEVKVVAHITKDDAVTFLRFVDTGTDFQGFSTHDDFNLDTLLTIQINDDWRADDYCDSVLFATDPATCVRTDADDGNIIAVPLDVQAIITSDGTLSGTERVIHETTWHYTITVKSDPPPPPVIGTFPVIDFHGESELTYNVGDRVNLAIRCTDAEDGRLNFVAYTDPPSKGLSVLETTVPPSRNIFNVYEAGVHTYDLFCVDSDGNQATDTLTITFEAIPDTTPPYILHNAADVPTLIVNSLPSDTTDWNTAILSARCSDSDGHLISDIELNTDSTFVSGASGFFITHDIDITTVGVYTITANCRDEAGNTADTLTRQVHIVPNPPPSNYSFTVDPDPITVTTSDDSAVISFEASDESLGVAWYTIDMFNRWDRIISEVSGSDAAGSFSLTLNTAGLAEDNVCDTAPDTISCEALPDDVGNRITLELNIQSYAIGNGGVGNTRLNDIDVDVILTVIKEQVYPPIVLTTSPGQPYVATEGVPFSLTYTADAWDPAVTTYDVAGNFVGPRTENWLTVTSQTPTLGIFTLSGTPEAADVGEHLLRLSFIGYNDDGEALSEVTSMRKITVESSSTVQTSPAVTPNPGSGVVPTFTMVNADNRKIVVGEDINTLDPPITFTTECGDDTVCSPLELSLSEILPPPAWLTLVKENGVWQFKGTPTASDVGTITLIVNSVGHPTDFGLNFVFEVIGLETPTFTMANTVERTIFVGEDINTLDPLITFTTVCDTACSPLELNLVSIPDSAWLSLVKQSDGTWQFKGTPTASDVGTITLIVNSVGHPTDFGLNFDFEVIGPTIPIFTMENAGDRMITVGNNINTLDPLITFTTVCATAPCSPLDLSLSEILPIPAWLTLVKENGVWQFKGTPAASDVGQVIVNVQSVGHPTDFGVQFDFEVIGPTIPIFTMENAGDRTIVVGNNINTLDPPITFTTVCATAPCSPLDLSLSEILPIPAWLTLVKENGVWQFKGTPAASDVGTITLIVNSVGHPTDFGVQFDFEVIGLETPTFAMENAVDRKIVVGNNINTLDPPITFTTVCGDDTVCSPLELSLSDTPPHPAWLSLTQKNDGTWHFTGTPAASDAGTDMVVIVQSVGYLGEGGTDVFTFNVIELETPTFAMANAIGRTIAVGDNINTLNPPITFTPECGDDTACSPLELNLVSIPDSAWLSLVKQSDGTWQFKGTPTASDVGTITLIVNSVGHPTDFGLNFDFEVIEPTIPIFTMENAVDRKIVVGNNINTLDPPITFTTVCGDDTVCSPLELSLSDTPPHPAWLSLTQKNDGTWHFTGTPVAASDVGLVIVNVQSVGHPTDFELPFVFNVIELTTPTFAMVNAVDRKIVVGEDIGSLNPPITFTTLCGDDAVCSPLELSLSEILPILPLPDWLSLEKKSDGTWQFKGTPAASDVGQVIVNVQSVGHPTDFGVQFDFVVTDMPAASASGTYYHPPSGDTSQQLGRVPTTPTSGTSGDMEASETKTEHNKVPTTPTSGTSGDMEASEAKTEHNKVPTTPTLGTSGDTKKKKSGGEGNDWKKKPTFGKSWEVSSAQLVKDGFSFNGHTLDITSNWHTDFLLTSSIIGKQNTVTIKTYAADGLRSAQLYLGVPEVGDKTNAEVGIIVNLQRNHTNTAAGYDIVSIQHEQDEPLVNVNETSATISNVHCTPSDNRPYCSEVALNFTVMAPLTDEVLAISAVDTKRRSTVTYINEGVEFVGESLLDPATARLFVKNTSQEPGSYITLTQEDRRYEVWADQDDYLWTQNGYGTWTQMTMPDYTARSDDPSMTIKTRVHSDFAKLVEYEQDKAKLVFDADTLISIPDELYVYAMPAKMDKKHDMVLLEKMSIEEVLALEKALSKYIYYDKWYAGDSNEGNNK